MMTVFMGCSDLLFKQPPHLLENRVEYVHQVLSIGYSKLHSKDSKVDLPGNTKVAVPKSLLLVSAKVWNVKRILGKVIIPFSFNISVKPLHGCTYPRFSFLRRLSPATDLH